MVSFLIVIPLLNVVSLVVILYIPFTTGGASLKVYLRILDNVGKE